MNFAVRIILLFCIFFSLTAQAQINYKVETLPNPKDMGGGYVSDPDDFLSANEVASINQICSTIEQNGTAQVAVVLVNSIGDQNPKMFATALFNEWGIGQAGSDNGLLILSVMDQRRTEFETGYGMEAVLPDIYCYRIGMQVLVPYFREGQYGAGLIATLENIQRILDDPSLIEEWRAKNEQYDNQGKQVLTIYSIADLLFHIIIGILVFLTLRSKSELYDKFMDLRKINQWWFILLFPLPFIFVFFYLERKKKKLRNHPRYSKLNGKLMHKLDEKADDRFLQSGQITEEEIKSVDYDVWVTDDEDDVLVLPYSKPYSKYKTCPACNFKTYHHYEKVLKSATRSRAGLKLKNTECRNCNYQTSKEVIIPRITSSSSGGGRSGGGGGSWGGGSSGGGGAGVGW